MGKRLYWPAAMRIAPELPQLSGHPPIETKYALLINPFYPKDPHASFGKHVLTPTLALTSIAAATPRDWKVRYWDENLLQGAPPVEPFPQVVGITVHLTFAKRAYQLARFFRERGSCVILGGLHVLSCPDEAAPHADALALGEGVQLWPVIINDIEQGQLRKRYLGSYRLPYGHEPSPARELLPPHSFLTRASVIATRGCHNRCGFCYLATEGLHIPYQCKEPSQILDEIVCTDEPYSVFIDNNLGSRPEYLRALSRALTPLQKIWSAAVTIDVTDDPGLVHEMALSGCTAVFIGFESLSDENITEAKKRSPRTEDYARRVGIFHDHGIQVNGSFVLGFDHDSPAVFENTVAWIEKNRLECATFHILTPYPGTPLYKQMEQQNRLLHKNWDLYDTAHVVFNPKRMTVEQLAEGYDWCYRTLFSHRSIWRRRPKDLTALPAYLAGCYLYKRANRLWPFLIRHNLTGRIWRPLVELSRKRHMKFRKRLVSSGIAKQPGTLLSAGV